MKLQSYLKKNGLSRGEFAHRIGVSEVSVGRYIAGTRVPRSKTMKKIARETAGEVTANDFVFVQVSSPQVESYA